MTTDTQKDAVIATEAELEAQIERKVEHEKHGDADPEAQNSGEFLDEIYDIVDAVVSRTDDPTMPAFTFRVIFLGIIMCILLAFVNTILSFRTVPFTTNPIIGVLLAYPLGILFAKVLPTKKFNLFGTEVSLNPGPFNHKEHALIYIWASSGVGSGGGNAYAMYNVIGQKYKLGQDLATVSAVFFTMTTNIFGFGLAGLCRRYLVRPPAMLWPGTLSVIAMLNSLHNEVKIEGDKYKLSRYNFFWIVTAGMFLYQFLPSFVMPVLTSFSLLCYLSSNPKVKFLGSAAPLGGVGMLSFSFDWNIITTMGPITSPLWAILNQILGYWMMIWVVVPALWSTNAFGIDSSLGNATSQGPNGTGRYPHGMTLNTPDLFNKAGKRVRAAIFTFPGNLTLDQNTYDKNRPIYITTYFTMEYISSFLVFTAAICHVSLWYGRDIWHRFRTAMKDLDNNDVHARLMDAYPDVPDWWYFVTLGANIIMSIFVCQFGGFDLAWWGVILALAISVIGILPIGVIYAISGQGFGLNVISEFLIGLILPGHIAAVMTFKTLSTMALAQGLGMVSDLKISHYLKIPPRAMFLSQMVSTLIVGIINVFISFSIYESFGRVQGTDPANPGCNIEPVDPYNCKSPNVWRLDSAASPPEGWSGNGYTVFFNAGTIWGAIGPARFFGPGSPYQWTLICFLIGAVAPVIPYLLHKAFPNGYWHLVNFVLIIVFPGGGAGSTRSDLVTPLIVAIVVNYFVKKYRHQWWKKYAYVMSAAFDSGTAIALTVMFFAFQFNQYYQILMKPWWGNPADQENCAPDWYLTCAGNANFGAGYNKTYNILDDPYCYSINFQNGACNSAKPPSWCPAA